MLAAGWAACDDCHWIIALDERDVLAERGAQIFQGTRFPEEVVRKLVADTQRLFWDNHTGPPRLEEWATPSK